MSSWFWNILSRFFNLVGLGAFFSLAAFMAHIEIKDHDLWLHLATGRYILDHGVIPRVDILSCTIAGAPWVNHEWLFQVIIAFLHRHLDFDGLVLMQTCLIVVTLFLLLRCFFRRDRLWLSIPLLLLTLLVYSLRFTIRPDLFSLLFLVLYIYLFHYRMNRRSTVILLVALQVLWANLHGFFVVGPVVLATLWIGEVLRRRLPLPWEWKEAGPPVPVSLRYATAVLFGVVVANLVNPYLFEGALYPFHALASLREAGTGFFYHIGELHPSLPWQTLTDFSVQGPYKILILVSLLSFILNHRRINPGHLLLWLIFLVLSAKALRNMMYFSLVAYIVVLANMQGYSFRQWLPPRLQTSRARVLLKILIIILALAWMGRFFEAQSLRGYYDFERYERKSEYGGITQRNYPKAAVDFLLAHDITGCTLNDFNSGAYLLGRGYPQLKVFIDGRTEVYGYEFFNRYQRFWKGDRALLEEALNRYPLTIVFLNSVYRPVVKDLVAYFYEHPAWTAVYFDYDAVIFLKDVEEHRQVIRERAVDFQNWTVPSYDLERIGLTKVVPYPHLNRAQVLADLGYYDAAWQELEEALRLLPNYMEAYSLRGWILLARGEPGPAYVEFRKAKMLNPSHLDTRLGIARALENLGRIDEARGEVRTILRVQPWHLRAKILLTQLDLHQGVTATAQRLLAENVRVGGIREDWIALLEQLISGGHCDLMHDFLRKFPELMEDVSDQDCAVRKGNHD